MIFSIKLAGQVIKIDSIFDNTYNFCEDYIVNDETTNINIEMTLEDIKKEKNISNEYGNRETWCKPNYKDFYLENLSLYRKIAEAMLSFSTLLMHGAVVATDNNNCYMFTAVSGTGKTTHTELWLKNLKGSFIVNGDKPLIKIEPDNVLACGTPWSGKEGRNKNCMIPLRGICIIERAEKNKIKEISFNEAFVTLLQQTYRPSDALLMKKTLDLLKDLSTHVKFYKMSVNNFASDAFEVSYTTMTKD